MAIEKIEPVDDKGILSLMKMGIKLFKLRKTKKTDCYEYGTGIYAAYFGGYLLG